MVFFCSYIFNFNFFNFFIFKPKADLKQIDGEDEFDFILKNLVGVGPGKDGIPSIDKPIYLKAEKAILDDDEKIFGVNYKGFVVDYPQNIIYWHVIANENVQGAKI